MNATDLSRRLKQLRRAVIMLQTEFRSDQLDEGLLTEIEQQMDHGIATDPRCIVLVALVDALRESTLTPRKEMFRDSARACEQLKDGIEQVIERVS